MTASTLALFALLAWLSPAEDPAAPAAAPEPEPAPTWRFRDASKPVKVMVLGGSTGAFAKQPYAKEIGRLCKNVEVKNLSKTGLGAFPQKKHFRKQVLENQWLKPRDPKQEWWLVHAGTVNSVANPYSTNHHVKNTIVLAHKSKMKVVGLTLTPWGDERDKRFRGLGGLKYRRWSQLTADFVMQRADPQTALGSYAEQRKVGEDAEWDPSEVPDVAVDLYDSALRHRDAMPRDFEAARAMLRKDAKWSKEHADLDPGVRETLLIADATELMMLPLWYLREEFRSFDHIHPNRDGHQVIGATICAKMPESWGCECEEPDPQ